MEMIDPFVFRPSIFVLAIFVGYYVVWSVTPALPGNDGQSAPANPESRETRRPFVPRPSQVAPI